MKKGKQDFEQMKARIMKERKKHKTLRSLGFRKYCDGSNNKTGAFVNKIFMYPSSYFPEDVWLEGILSYDTSTRDKAAKMILDVVTPFIEDVDLTRVSAHKYTESILDYQQSGVYILGDKVNFTVDNYNLDSRPLGSLKVSTGENLGKPFNPENYFGLVDTREKLFDYYKSNGKNFPALNKELLDDLTETHESLVSALLGYGIRIRGDYSLSPLLSIDGYHFTTVPTDELVYYNEAVIANHILGEKVFPEVKNFRNYELLNPLVDGNLAVNAIKEYFLIKMKGLLNLRIEVAKDYTEWVKEQTILNMYYAVKEEGELNKQVGPDISHKVADRDGQLEKEEKELLLKLAEVTDTMEIMSAPDYESKGRILSGRRDKEAYIEENKNNKLIYPELSLVGKTKEEILEVLPNHFEKVNAKHTEELVDEYGNKLDTQDYIIGLNGGIPDSVLWGDILGDWF